jgi:tRNA U38,U39,U40 pseudouridine synthase TruA
LGEREGDKFLVADIRRMMIRILHVLKEALKEDIQKQLNESQENMD